jgi:hypothetical protein
MGPENSDAGSFELYTPGGEKMEMVYGMPPITVQTAAEAAREIRQARTTMFRVRLGKEYRCRSRKRFVKLLMSKGIERNYAQKVAEQAREQGGYRYVWQGWLFWGVVRL